MKEGDNPVDYLLQQQIFMYMLEISIFVYMCMEGRMEGRQEIILVDYLIQILTSLGMLETKITVHM